jgi:pimeloyl-ACP methyl ester carboxylesterase
MSLDLVFVPGTGGVTYSDGTGEPAATVFDLFVANASANRLLRLERRDGQLPPAVNGLTPGTDLSIVYRWFNQARKLTGGARWDPFPYDWRVDIRLSGQRLANHIRRAASGRQFHLVGHSQGSVVILEAARQLGAKKFGQAVRSVVFFGTPFFGTHNTTIALVKGAMFGRRVHAETARTWPALYQMMPRWDLETLVIDRSKLFRPGPWRDAGLLGASNDTTRGVDPDLLGRGVEWMLLHPARTMFDPLAEVRWVRFVWGNSRKTPVGYHAFPDLGAQSQITQSGDATVADFQTYRHLPEWVRRRCSHVHLATNEHFLMGNDDNVYSLCLP